MFSLAYGFLKWWFSKTEVQILILGLDHAGKTTLLEQMKGVFLKTKGIPLDKIPPTVGEWRACVRASRGPLLAAASAAA